MKISRFNTKIMALTLIVILCSNLLCGVILIRFINQTLHNQIIEDNDRMIGEATNRFDAYVDDISTFGKVLSMDQQMQLLLRQTDTVLNTYPYFHDVQDLSEQLKRFTLMMENYVEDIYIVRDGNLPIVSGKNLLSYQDSVRESWYQEFLASQKWRAFSTEVQTIRSQNNRDVEVFHYLQNIYDLQNPKEKLGTLVVVLKCTPIQNMLETESAGEVSYLLLRGGEALYPQEFPLEGASIRSSLAVKSQLQENWVDNGQYYFSRSIGKTDWTLIEILPGEVIEKQIWKTILLLILLLVGTLAVACIVFLTVMYRITHPLKVLAAGIDKVSAGNLDVRIDLHTKDELTDIANLFNDMVVKIRMLLAESVKQEKQKQDLKLRLLICTPNTGHPVLGVFLCDTVTSTRRSAWNCTDKGNGQKHQTE